MAKKLIWKESDESGGSYRVYRGGSWGIVDVYVRASFRLGDDPGYRSRFLGFRCARLLETSNVKETDLEKEQ